KMGGEPYSVLFVGIGASIFAFIARLIIVNKLIYLPITVYLREVFGRGMLIISTVGILYYFFLVFLLKDISFWWESVIISFCVFFAIAIFGFGNLERSEISNQIKNIVKRFYS